MLYWVDWLCTVNNSILVSKKSIKQESAFYHSLNIGGSILLIVNTCYYGAFPSAVVNIVWVIIGALYISKIKFA